METTFDDSVSGLTLNKTTCSMREEGLEDILMIGEDEETKRLLDLQVKEVNGVVGR